MTDMDIRQVLAQATDDIEPEPDLLDRVRAGGRQRVLRRRAVLAGGLAVAATAVAVPLVALPRTPRWDPATRGDLAHDRDFLARVLSFWRGEPEAEVSVFAPGPGEMAMPRVEKMFTTSDEPRVTWAGRAGTEVSAAVVVQRAVIDGSARDVSGLIVAYTKNYAAMSLAGPLHVVPRGSDEPWAVVSRAINTMLVVDHGHALEYSESLGYDNAGRVARTFRPLPPSPDGVSVVSVPKQLPSITVAVKRIDTGTRVAVVNSVGAATPERLTRMLPGSERAWPADPSDDELRRWSMDGRSPYYDTYGNHGSEGVTAWTVRGATPDGRRFVVQTLVYWDQSRLFRFLGSDQPAYLGMLGRHNSTKVLDPVRGEVLVLHVRLPERQGVVVAASHATLRYRAGHGDWLPLTGDAALLPDAATGLDVRLAAGKRWMVELP